MPTNTTIEYVWEGIKLGSPSPIQVIQYDSNGEIEEIFDFDNDENGYWNAVDKFQELIERQTNQTPPPPSPCNEDEEEQKLREQLKESGLNEEQIDTTVEAMKPLCPETPPPPRPRDVNPPPPLPPPPPTSDCKPEVLLALTGVDADKVRTTFRTMRNLVGTLKTISESEFDKLGENKTQFIELIQRCGDTYFGDLGQTQQN